MSEWNVFQFLSNILRSEISLRLNSIRFHTECEIHFRCIIQIIFVGKKYWSDVEQIEHSSRSLSMQIQFIFKKLLSNIWILCAGNMAKTSTKMD